MVGLLTALPNTQLTRRLAREGLSEGSPVLTEPEISQNDKHDDYDPNDVEDVAAHDVPPLFDHAPTGTQPTPSL
jgi:hypothetical protein